MKTLIIDNQTKHLQELSDSFPNAFVVDRNSIGSVNWNDYDLVVLSGGVHVPTVVNHAEEYKKEFELIYNFNKPIIGICLGCEIICKAFEGDVAFLPQKEQGEKTFEILDESLKEIMGSDEFVAYEAHSVGISRVPEEFTVLAQSNHGPEIIKHKTRPILGIQFHPEVHISRKLWNWILSQ